MAAIAPSATSLSTHLENCLDDQLRALREQIILRAEEIANPSSATDSTSGRVVDLQSLSKAIDEVVQGPAAAAAARSRVFDYFPPFTIVCTLLCLAFALLGLVPLFNESGSKVATATASFLDIAKIFAGAIVGSTTSVALSAARARRARPSVE